MFTENSLLKAKIDLYNILANHSYEDYYRTNYKINGKRKGKKYIPYSLSGDTQEAQKIYSMVYGKKPEDITPEQEEQIKAFLIKYRTTRRKYLKDAGGNNYYNTQDQKNNIECEYLETENCDLARFLKVCKDTKCKNYNNTFKGILI